MAFSITNDEEVRITSLMTTRLRCDPARYKVEILLRCVQGRMHLRGLSSTADYVAFLEAQPEEIDELCTEWSSGLTWFFRGPTAFAALGHAGLAPLLAKRPRNAPFRVWVIGCSTGEEAYSLAILIAECAERVGKGFDVQIFATDVDTRAIAVSRRGRYGEESSRHVDAQRLARFFTRDYDGYRVNDALRRGVWFGSHDALQDPPFRNIDLVSCRNLLIHLRPEAQRDLLCRLHQSLNADGLLFLSSHSDVTEAKELFAPVGFEPRIFRKAAANPESSGRDALDEAPGGLQTQPWRGSGPNLTMTAILDDLQKLKARNEQLQSAVAQSRRDEQSVVRSDTARKEESARRERAETDLWNVLTATSSEYISLDEQLRVSSFSAGSCLLFPGLPSLLGSTLDGFEGSPVLLREAASVLRTLEPRTCRMEANGWSLSHVLIRPYRTLENAVRGVLILISHPFTRGSAGKSSYGGERGGGA